MTRNLQIAYQIAPMTNADVPGIMEIQAECHLSPWSADSYLTALRSPDFILYTAKINKNLIGFIAARLITGGQLCELLNIGLIPAQQNKKIGEGLIYQLFSKIESKADRISLEVREGNGRAIGFYKKYGFKPVGLRKNYYSNPAENALLMEKMLN